MRLANAFRQEAPFCLEKDFLGARTLDGGCDGERRWENLEAFERKIEMKIVAPFCVGDGTALNEAKKFESLPAKVLREFRIKIELLLFRSKICVFMLIFCCLHRQINSTCPINNSSIFIWNHSLCFIVMRSAMCIPFTVSLIKTVADAW